MGLIIDIIIVVLLLILTICEITFTKVLSRLEKKLTDEEKPKWFDFERLKNQVEVQWRIIKDLEDKVKKLEMPKEEKEKIEKTERRIDITI
jgi:cell division protein FtsN